MDADERFRLLVVANTLTPEKIADLSPTDYELVAALYNDGFVGPVANARLLHELSLISAYIRAQFSKDDVTLPDFRVNQGLPYWFVSGEMYDKTRADKERMIAQLEGMT